jgi:hypothetical protein
MLSVVRVQIDAMSDSGSVLNAREGNKPDAERVSLNEYEYEYEYEPEKMSLQIQAPNAFLYASPHLTLLCCS